MTQKRATLSRKIPSKALTLALKQSAALMRDYRKDVMTAEMLLLSFLKMPDTEAYRLLRHFSKERGFNWAGFEHDVERAASSRGARDAGFDFAVDARRRIPLGNEMIVVLDEGLTIAQSQDKNRCGTGHALAVMADITVGTCRLLNKHGITQRAVTDAMSKISLVTATGNAVDHVAMAKKGQMIPVYFRDELLLELVNLLSMTRDRHVVLVGATGVGKRSLILSLAQLMAEGKGPAGLKSVVQMSERALLEDPHVSLYDALRMAKDGILFVPDINRFFGGSRAEFDPEACKELQKALLSNDVVIIGTTTVGRYNDWLAKSSVVTEHMRRQEVPPATVAETEEMLSVLRTSFQADYGLEIIDDSLQEAARLAGRYYTEEPLPGAAVHLLHRACAMVKMSVGEVGESTVKKDNQLDPDDVMVATSMLTGIPVTNMDADERSRYANMVGHLHKRIIGQDEAVLVLSRAVKMARVGLKDPKRPIGSFLFLGPTGVGKTELGKALAEFMFGAESALITLDMSEYMDDSSVNRLIGSPPGYVGHEAGGQLTDAVKKQPYSVVLFDEVEKAAVKVFDVLLQVMDEGRLTSGQGETVSFSECVILMTSNIGGRDLADPDLGEAIARERAGEKVNEHFRPEFLNRLSDIIYFHLLTDDNLSDILDLLLGKEEALMSTRNLQLDMSPAAKKWLLKQNDHPEWGARPLRRIIQKHIREPMADFLLTEDPQEGTTVNIRVKSKKLVFETKKA